MRGGAGRIKAKGSPCFIDLYLSTVFQKEESRKHKNKSREEKEETKGRTRETMKRTVGGEASRDQEKYGGKEGVYGLW